MGLNAQTPPPQTGGALLPGLPQPIETIAFAARGANGTQVPVKTNLFAHGGHGLGFYRAIGKPVGAWPDLWLAWPRTTGLV